MAIVAAGGDYRGGGRAVALARTAQPRPVERAEAARDLAAGIRVGGADSVAFVASGAERGHAAPQQNVVAVLVDDSRSMAIRDEAGSTREAAAKAVLSDGLLKSLAGRFQVRLYRFGKDLERVPQPDALNPTEPATRIGDTLERVLAESSSLPLGAIVVLSDGADNSGGLNLETVAAIRRSRIPVDTVGFGQEHPDRDTEVVDAVVAPRALPQSRLSAVVTLQSYGLSGTRAKLSVRDGGKVLAGQDVTLKGDGALQTRNHDFNCGDAGAKTLQIGVEPLPGETNLANNRLARLVNVESRKPRILYMEGEPRWELSSSAARCRSSRAMTTPIRKSSACSAPPRTRCTCRGKRIPRNWPTASPPRRKTCSRFRG